LNITVKEIVTAYLKSHGFDALLNESGILEDCGCAMHHQDFMKKNPDCPRRDCQVCHYVLGIYGPDFKRER